ncbi:glycosyl hydrolase family 28-related protein [Paenibacillus sp. SI8]|uniref:glycosyl hydrolase family 28-related protein n=1 Tax=unclassified Paenibacillus TaxID=185978 RepID=UPI00346638A0
MAEREDKNISRRKFITGVGVAGITLLAGRNLFAQEGAASGQTVTNSTYGNPTIASTPSVVLVNVKDFGAIPNDGLDHSNHFQAAIQAITEYGVVFVPAGNYKIDSDITVSNKKQITLITNGETTITGNGQLIFTSSIDSFHGFNNISAGQSIITSNASVPFQIGDYLEIVGTVEDGDSIEIPPTQPRYPVLHFIAKVVDISSNIITLDREIKYAISSVSAAKVTSPYTIDIEKGFTFESFNVSFKYCVGGTINILMTGKTLDGRPGLAFEKSCDFSLFSTSWDLNSTHSITLEHCNRFNIDVHSKNNSSPVKLVDTGDTGVQVSEVPGAAVIRGNGIQDGNIKAFCNSTWVAEMIIRGGRNLNIIIESTDSGRFLLSWTPNKPGNYSEACQFSECKDITIKASLANVFDQAIEFLSVERGTIKAKISTLSSSTEGAIVIKGKSKNIDIIDTEIVCYNAYGIKFEYINGMSGNHRVVNPRINNMRNDGTGISIRDSAIILDANVSIIGGLIKASVPILVNQYHNRVIIRDTKIEATVTHGVILFGDYHELSGSIVITPAGKRAVVVFGLNTKVNNLTSDFPIFIKDIAFDIRNFRNNKVSSIFIEPISYTIKALDGKYSVDSLPQTTNWEAGEYLFNTGVANPGVIGWIRVGSGATGSWKEVKLSN